MSSEDNKGIVRRYHQEVLEFGRTNVIEDLVDPGFVYHEPVVGEVKGHEGLKQLVTMYKSAFPDVAATIEDVFGEGDRVAARLVYRGTHNGEFQGMGPTGKPIDVRSITIARLTAGKIVEEWEVFDAMGMMQQLGAIPPMGPA